MKKQIVSFIILFSAVSSFGSDRYWKNNREFLHFLTDPQNLVSDEFKVRSKDLNSVVFWYMIYTKVDSSLVVIHDKNDLSLIYDVVEVTRAQQRLREIKQRLQRLSNLSKQKKLFGRDELNKVSSSLRKGSSAFYRELIENVRTQTGQRDRIEAGLSRSGPYEKFLIQLTQEMKIPRELKSISFLESSFNPRATSRVGAKGVWQLMPGIGRKLLPKSSQIDYRENVALSSVSAFHLLKQNFRILKNWEKSITAYNSGLGQFIGKKNNRRIRFASRNFYPEFLALTHALAYRKQIFDVSSSNKKPMMKIYLASCSSKIRSFWDNIKKHNHHLESDDLRNSKVYFASLKRHQGFKEISLKTLAMRTPAQIDKDHHYNCSTR